MITTIVVILLVIAMLFVYKTYSPKAVAGAKEITIVVNHLNGDKKTFDIKTDEEYLRGALEQEFLEVNLLMDFGSRELMAKSPMLRKKNGGDIHKMASSQNMG